MLAPGGRLGQLVAVFASIAGWINAYLPSDTVHPGDGGHELDLGFDDADDWLDRAA